MDISSGDLEKIANLYNGMEGKSEDELIAELAQMIRSGQGGISASKAKGMINTILPIMDGEQKRKLQKLLRFL